MAALAAIAATATAHADDNHSAFGAFAAVCAVPAADFDVVESAADSQGWVASDTIADASMPGVTVRDQLSRSKSVDGASLKLSAWRGLKGGVMISDCALRLAKAEYPAAVEAAKAWITFAPQDSTSKHTIFRFTDATGTHRALTSADFDAAAGGAGLEILTVSSDQSGTVLDLLLIKK